MDGMDFGLLAIRTVVGSLIVGHGVGNLFGWLGGFGLDGTGAIFERLGFRPGRLFAAVAGAVELGTGSLLLLGLLTPLAAAGIVGIMLTTIFTAHAGKGPWYFNGGWEYNLTLLTVAAAVAFIGPGATSLDAALSLDLSGLTWGIAASAVGLTTGSLSLAVRGQPTIPAEPATDRTA